MPTSLLQDRVDAIWQKINDIVETALRFETGTRLGDVIPITGRDAAPGAWGSWTSIARPTRWRKATSPAEAVARERRFVVSYDNLEDPPLDDIKTWATDARKLELEDVLDRVAAKAKVMPLNTPPPQTVPAGWGQPRFVHSSLSASDVARLATVAEEKRITLPMPIGTDALVFRLGDGPAISSGPDIKLGWIPTIDGIELGIELVLVSQARLYNADPAHVTKL